MGPGGRDVAGPVVASALAVVIIGLLGLGLMALPRVDGQAALLPQALTGRPVLVAQTDQAPAPVRAPVRARRPATPSAPPLPEVAAEAAPVTPTTGVVLPEPVPQPAPPPPPVFPPVAEQPAGPVTALLDSRRAAEVLAGLSYPWQRLGFDITFLPARRGVLGATYLEERRIEIYVRADQTPLQLAHVIGHELGHAVDATYGTPQRRREWMRLRGMDPALDWWGCLGCRDYATPAGDFAEVFAYWLAGPDSGFNGRLAGPPVQEDMHLLTPFFWP
ncbi:MAG TPA: hypothetical protein VHE80_07615 [Acidimicrobiales bacterium]|nr:hypothetical protein [Acidimicrobiales bacterium]